MSSSRLATWLRAGDRWIPACFVLFFLVVFAVNGVMVSFAVTSWTGLVNDAPYDRGIRYNEKLEGARAQEGVGWRARLAFEDDGPQAGLVAVDVADRSGQPVEQARVHARFFRPTHEGHDFLVPLAPRRGGGYGARVELPLAGVWDVRVQVDRGEVSFRFAERLFVRR